MPDDFRCLRCEYSCAYLNYPARTRLRVHWAPGIPRALFDSERRKCLAESRAHHAAERRACLQLRGRHRNLNCHRPRKRTIQYSRDVGDEMDRPRRTGYPAYAGYDGGGRGELLPVIARHASDKAIEPTPPPAAGLKPSSVRSRTRRAARTGNRLSRQSRCARSPGRRARPRP